VVVVSLDAPRIIVIKEHVMNATTIEVEEARGETVNVGRD